MCGDEQSALSAGAPRGPARPALPDAPEPPASAHLSRVSFLALGCRVNRADMDSMASQVAGPFTAVREGEPADFVVVNTCSITHDADSAARQAIRRAAREHPTARIVVTGCYAGLAPDVLGALPGVAAVLGVQQQSCLREVLTRLAADPSVAAISGRELAPGLAWAPPAIEPHAHTRPFLKIQDGCDQRCSFCVVPLARGASRSMPFDEALAQLGALGRRHAEVVLTGVHLGAYGRDLAPARGLTELLRAAVESRSVGRLRLSSIESEEFPVEALVDPAVAGVLCQHFHMPMQSGSASVLRRMRRRYDPDSFRQRVLEVAALFPDACLGTDVMVGFPGETDEEFRETVRLLEQLPFAYLHVFPFSARPGTPAATMEALVPGPVIRERAREVVALGDRRWRTFLKGLAGHVLEVVVEKIEGGLARGTSRQFATVRWPTSGERRGDLVRVRVEACDGQECFGISARTFASRLPP